MLDKTYEELDFYIERNRFEDAEDLLATKLKEFPEDETLLYFSAYIDYRYDEHYKARETLHKLLENDPESDSARNLLFHIENETDNYPEAEKWIISLLKDYPESSTFYADYARLMLNTMNFEKAEKLAEESIRLDPDNEKSLFIMALINIINKKGSNEEFTQLLVNHPGEMHSLSIIITSLLDQNRISEARRVTTGALRADPSNQYLLATAKELKYLDHWSMKPITWLGNFGMLGSIGIWFGIIILARMDQVIDDPLYSKILTPVLFGYIAFCIYTWVYPFIFKKLFLR